jgi:hypothetical protein
VPGSSDKTGGRRFNLLLIFRPPAFFGSFIRWNLVLRREKAEEIGISEKCTNVCLSSTFFIPLSGYNVGIEYNLPILLPVVWNLLGCILWEGSIFFSKIV